MATTAASRLFSAAAAILLALALGGAVSGARPRRSWVAGSIEEEESSTCVPLRNDSCVRSFFVGGLRPQVGYAGSDNPAKTLREKETEFRLLGLDRMVCDNQCFSNLPNLATFLTYVYFPPCHEGGGVLAPCRSLCEAAREEYSRYSSAEMALACPTADTDNVANSAQFENAPVLDLKVFNCSRYLAEGACVPNRTAPMSCDFIPSTHAARLVHQAHFQTGYPSPNSDSPVTHLHSFGRANLAFKASGLEAMVRDVGCRRWLPNTMFFLTFAYFPVCTAHKGSDSSLTYPCRKGCDDARNELQRFIGRENLLCYVCPAACNITTTVEEVLGLPVFNRSVYPAKLCVKIPDDNAVTREHEPPARPTCNCSFNASVCLRKRPCSAAIRSHVSANSLHGKKFGK